VRPEFAVGYDLYCTSIGNGIGEDNIIALLEGEKRNNYGF
jgi:hypothetical protein